MKFNIKQSLVLFILIFAFVGGAFSQYIRIQEHKENDHWVYFRTAKRIENKNVEEIYSRKDGALPFRYSPPTLMLFSWMSQYTEKESRQGWLLIQSIFIFFSFLVLYKILFKMNSPNPLLVLACSLFLFYRYFLDSLFCGQVSGIVFFLFTIGLYYWVEEKNKLSNIALLLLCFLKIVPGFILLINFFAAKSLKDLLKMILHLTIVLLFLIFVYYLWFIHKFGPSYLSNVFSLFQDWLTIALEDQSYFDGSTLKSQSLRGALLRLFGSNQTTEQIWRSVFCVSLLSLFVLWFKVHPRALKLRIYSYLIGVVSFVLLMPESLPYQFFKLLIPAIFLINELFLKKNNFLIFLVSFIFIFCCLSSTDLTGHHWADTIQHYSFPFLATVMMVVFFVKELLVNYKIENEHKAI